MTLISKWESPGRLKYRHGLQIDNLDGENNGKTNVIEKYKIIY